MWPVYTRATPLRSRFTTTSDSAQKIAPLWPVCCAAHCETHWALFGYKAKISIVVLFEGNHMYLNLLPKLRA